MTHTVDGLMALVDECRSFPASKGARSQCRAALAAALAGAVVPPGMKLLKDSTFDERSWPEDYAHENGSYFCCCCNCGRQFQGHKRRVVCKVCAAAPPLPVEPRSCPDTDKANVARAVPTDGAKTAPRERRWSPVLKIMGDELEKVVTAYAVGPHDEYAKSLIAFDNKLAKQLDRIAPAQAADALDAARLWDALVWALGAGDDFPGHDPAKGAYWWRKELAQRAGMEWDGEKFVAAMRAAGEAT